MEKPTPDKKTSRTKGGKKSSLMTPDPYHVPGYGGFCPQFKYQIGETFGKTSSRLLRDQSVASSGNLVLAQIAPPSDDHPDPRYVLLRSRTHSMGDRKLLEKMVPGYTGFIPKSQHYFGKRYAENCVNAISDFEGDQRKKIKMFRDLQIAEAMQTGQLQKTDGDDLPPLTVRYQTPLKAIGSPPIAFMSKEAAPHTMSPFYMDNQNPDKCFVSGYTGFVPRARGLLGAGYPLITHTALGEFADDIKRHKNIADQPVVMKRLALQRADAWPIYPVDTGLVPHYTGHIPGQKFRYGKTFGHSTENALTKVKIPASA